MAETGKSFIKKFVGFSLVTWVSFAISFLTAPISTRLFEPEVLGKINIFNTYSNLFGILVLLGLDQAFARFYLERPNNQTKGYLFTFCFSKTYALLFVAAIIALPIHDLLSRLLFQEEDNLLLWLFFGSVFCTATLRYLNLSYRMEQNIKLYTIQGILMTLVSKVLYIGVGFWDPSYKPALIVLTVSHLLLALVFLFIQRSRFERIKEYDKLFTIEMVKFATPLIPVSILMWANTSIPQIVMQHTMDYYSIGVFTSATALANMILIIQAGFNTFWVPYTLENYKTQTGQFFKVHRYLVCVLTIFALCIILSQDIIFYLLGEKYRAAKSFFPFLILGPSCYIIGETTGIGIDISKRTYLNLVVFLTSVITNVILSILLSKVLGLPGIAIAVSIAAIVAMILKTIFGGKYYHILDSKKYMIMNICLISLGAIFTLEVSHVYIRSSIILTILLISFFMYKKEIKELSHYLKSFCKFK